MEDREIRHKQDQEQIAFEESLFRLSSIVMGEESFFARMQSAQKSGNACKQVLSYFGLPVPHDEEDSPDFEDRLHRFFEPHGVMWRTVELEDRWYQDAIGPLIAFTPDGVAVALIPAGASGYTFLDPASGKKTAVDKNTVKLLGNEALLFYKALPQKPLGLRDIVKYMISCIHVQDVVYILAITMFSTVLGMITPFINRMVFGYLIPHMLSENLINLFIIIANVGLVTMLIQLTKGLLTARVQTKVSLFVQSAFMQRVLMMDVGFFKDYTAGDLSYRMDAVNKLTGTIVNTVLLGGVGGVFSLVYLVQIAALAPSLVGVAAVMAGISLVITALSVVFGTGIVQKKMAASSKLNGWVYAALVGIQKIRLTGAEKRAFVKWTEQYGAAARFEYDPPVILKVLPVLSAGLPLLSSIVVYYVAAQSGMTSPDFMAFSSAYGLLLGSVMSLSRVIKDFVTIKPTLDLAEPILKQVPETSAAKRQVGKIRGDIKVDNLTFRYSENTPPVLNDISLHIREGEYVAIVGTTGCGKSTLLRLLMGFETPNVGAIYYDDMNLEALDVRSLRRNIGIVMQDGKLFSGSVLSNITISATHMSEEQAWKVAEIAGIADDIRRMPMKMNTHISEGDSGVSGGQKQRLMIARALASSPSIIMLDEATSALDNITQKQISDAIADLHTTRIVIAHRLSTIRQCDRILMLEDGKIIEEGTFDDLIAKGGSFTRLLERQMI